MIAWAMFLMVFCLLATGVGEHGHVAVGESDLRKVAIGDLRLPSGLSVRHHEHLWTHVVAGPVDVYPLLDVGWLERESGLGIERAQLRERLLVLVGRQLESLADKPLASRSDVGQMVLDQRAHLIFPRRVV